MERDDGIEFTVDELAREADVSRRTVFNHFDTVDDIVVAACVEVLRPILETFDSDGGVETTMFDELVAALRRPELFPAMLRVERLLGSDRETSSPRQAVLFLRVLTELGDRVAHALRHRHREVDELAGTLLVSSFISGTIAVHKRWATITERRDDESSPRVWSELLERLIDTIRSGHASARGYCVPMH